MSEERHVRPIVTEPGPGPAELFDGEVIYESIHRSDEGAGTNQSRVHFHHGASTHWHLHLGDQVLYFVEGKGMAQELGGEVIECGPGDVIEVPSGTRHIHGAMPGETAKHIAITHGETIWDHDPRYPGSD